MSDLTAWGSFLDRYHTQRPGITEDLLSPARDRQGHDPYTWLLEGVSDTGLVLDLACGSAPMHDHIGSSWIGLDRSAAELMRAQGVGRRPAVRGDAAALPFPDACFDTVVCSMALMLLIPTHNVLDEIARVLAPDGFLHVLVPTYRPLRFRDRRRFAVLYSTLRMTAKLPDTAFRRRPHRALAHHGFAIRSDLRRRFAYPIADDAAADRLLDGLYLPDAQPERVQAAQRRARRWKGSEIGLPLRRIIAQAPLHRSRP